MSHTKGFVLTKCKDVMLISEIVERTLNSFILSEKALQFKDNLKSIEARAAYKTAELTIRPSLKVVFLRITFQGTEHELMINFDADGDFKQYGSSSIAIYDETSDHSAILVQLVLYALSLLGPAYVDANDSLDEGYKLMEPPLTVLQSVKAGFANASTVGLWLTAWDAGYLPKATTFETFFGLTEAAARELIAIPRLELRAALQTLCDKLVVAPSFLIDFQEEMSRLGR